MSDAAVVLPLIGLFLLMPPAITLFVGPYDVAGVPLIVAYLFGVWAALVAGAALLARRIGRGDEHTGTLPEGEEGEGNAG